MTIKPSTHVRLSDDPKGWGIKTEIDGVEIPQVTNLQLHCPIEAVPQLTIEMLATRPLDIEVSAQVTINLKVMPGCSIVDTTSHDDPEGTRHLMITYPK